jgi:hypothetical protein
VPVDSPDGRCNGSVISIVLVSQNLERKKSRERSENDTPYDNPRLTTDFRCIFERALYSVFRGPSKSDKRRLYTQTRARSATDAKLGSSAAGRKVLIEYRLQYCIFTENPAFLWFPASRSVILVSMVIGHACASGGQLFGYAMKKGKVSFVCLVSILSSVKRPQPKS